MTEHERETLAPSRRAKPGATLSGQGVLFVINNMGGGGAEQGSYREVKLYRRRKRWLS